MKLNSLLEGLTYQSELKGHSNIVVKHRSGSHSIIQSKHPDGTFFHVFTKTSAGQNKRITKTSLKDAKEWLKAFKQ